MLIIIILAIILLILFFKLSIKKLCESHLNLFTGELKVGKSAFSLNRAIKRYNKLVLSWKIKKFIIEKIFHKQYTCNMVDENGNIKVVPVEKPLFYSNIPVRMDYVPLTIEILTRKERQTRKAVTWFDEASLFADSMSSIRCNGMSKSELDDFNKTLNNYIKLYCHATNNGFLYYNTQALTDLHYSFKRCTNRYFYLHSCIKWLPFIVIYRISELYHSEDNSSININLNGDILENTKLCFMSKRVWKKYDRFAYSSFTDNLPLANNIVHGKDLVSLKASYILSVIDLPNINTVPKDPVYISYKNKKIKLFTIKKLFKKKGSKKNDKKEIK